MHEDATPEDARPEDDSTNEYLAAKKIFLQKKKALIAHQHTLHDSEIGVIRIEIRGVGSPLLRKQSSREDERERFWDSDGVDMYSDDDPSDALHHPHLPPLADIDPSD